MKAIVITEDKRLQWSEVPEPVMKPGEVLLEIHATAINRADLMQRAGNYPPPPEWPEWPGLEAAGVVLEAPTDSRWRPGDRGCALLGGGGYAERLALPQELLMPVPAGLSLIEAAALPEGFATAWLKLCLEAGLAEGDRLFVQAGASGVGVAAIQLAKELGADVVTTVSSPEKEEFARSIGADVVINRKRESISTVLSRYPVDVALDCVAGPQLGAALETMAPGGRWVIIATLGGAVSEIDINSFFRRGIRLIGSTLRSRPNEIKARVLAELESRVWPAIAAGRIKVALHEVLPLSEAEAGHAILERNENLGKVVLVTPRGAV
ncbi:MAG: NAD(P)H-quinone oxidoreductase [Lentisphaerae bacterium]|nr:NAD(P)H-quinone oxidoreductase [Lentisphaerota bacterium]